MDIRFRKAGKDDSEFAYQTKKAAFQMYVEMVWGWEESEQLSLHDRRFNSQDCQVVQFDGTDIGIIALAIEPDCLKLNQIFLQPQYQNRGIGKVCIEKIIKELKPKHLPLRLGVLKVNCRALSFYYRLGFQETGSSDTHIFFELDS